jgi:hypothetical protein
MVSKPASRIPGRLARIGAIIGAAVPVALAGKSLLEMYSRPLLPPGQAYCTTSDLAAYFVVITAPVGSLVMAGAGWLLGKVLLIPGRCDEQPS